MSDLVDTSMLVRYLTGDPPALADRSAQIIDGESDLSRRVSFADALIWAAARAGKATVFTLDERFPREGIAVRTG